MQDLSIDSTYIKAHQHAIGAKKGLQMEILISVLECIVVAVQGVSLS